MTRPAPGPEADEATRSRDLFRRRRRARRWQLLRRVLAALAVAGLLAGAVWLVFFSSVLAVHRVEVRGTAVLDPAEVERVAAVPAGEPLALLDTGAVVARIEGLAPVASVEVSRAWPDGVVLEVTERQAVAAVVQEGAWRGIDAEGVLFRDYPSRPDGLTEVRARATTPGDALAEAAAVVDALPADLVAKVGRVEVESIDAITLRLRGGARVEWGSADSSAEKAEVLTALLAQKASAYDVTAPGRPTLRP